MGSEGTGLREGSGKEQLGKGRRGREEQERQEGREETLS